MGEAVSCPRLCSICHNCICLNISWFLFSRESQSAGNEASAQWLDGRRRLLAFPWASFLKMLSTLWGTCLWSGRQERRKGTGLGNITECSKVTRPLVNWVSSMYPDVSLCSDSWVTRRNKSNSPEQFSLTASISFHSLFIVSQSAGWMNQDHLEALSKQITGPDVQSFSCVFGVVHKNLCFSMFTRNGVMMLLVGDGIWELLP